MECPSNAMGERHNTVVVGIQVMRNDNNGLTDRDKDDRIISSGENSSSSLSKLRDEVNEKYVLKFFVLGVL